MSDRETTPAAAAPPGRIGTLARRALETAGLLPLAERVAAGEALTRDEAFALGGASFPLLAKLVELRPGRRFFPQEPLPRCDPTDAAPLALRQGVRGPSRNSESFEAFVDGLLEFREAVASSARTAAWSPRLSGRLDVGDVSDVHPLGEDVLRAIATAALVLPNSVAICVPVEAVGVKTSQVALRFGATCLCGRPSAEFARAWSLDRPTPLSSEMAASNHPYPTKSKVR